MEEEDAENLSESTGKGLTRAYYIAIALAVVILVIIIVTVAVIVVYKCRKSKAKGEQIVKKITQVNHSYKHIAGEKKAA